AGTMTFEWGTDESYGKKSQRLEVPLVPYERTMRHDITGLKPGTMYHVRVTTTSPAGTTVTKTQFGTQGAPTSSRSFVEAPTATSLTWAAQVHPHRLQTKAWIEWGETESLGKKGPVRTLSAVNYEMTVRSDKITGLTP